jgi:hypothetical protein
LFADRYGNEKYLVFVPVFCFGEINMLHATGTIAAGGTAQDAIAAGHHYNTIVFNNESDTDMRVCVDATAASNTGEIVYANTSATFNGLCGRKMSVLCATINKIYSLREAL